MKSYICLIFSIGAFINVSAQVTTDMYVEDDMRQSFLGVQVFNVNSLIDFKDSWENASGFYVTYGSISSNHWSLIFQTGYLSFNANADAGFTGDEKFNMIPLQIGTRYYLFLDRFRPFLLAMGGLNIIDAKYALQDIAFDGTEIEFNFQVGAGLGIILFNNIEIEGQLKYNSHLFEPSLTYNITGLEYGISLNWLLQ